MLFGGFEPLHDVKISQIFGVLGPILQNIFVNKLKAPFCIMRKFDASLKALNKSELFPIKSKWYNFVICYQNASNSLI